jgi:hypothetical protein
MTASESSSTGTEIIVPAPTSGTPAWCVSPTRTEIIPVHTNASRPASSLVAKGPGPSSLLRRHVQTLLYESFRHAQGDQALQVHFIHCYAHLLRAAAVPLDLSVRDQFVDRIRNRQVPRGHQVIVNLDLVRSQFEFWWLNMWDVLLSVYMEDPGLLPGPDQLAARSVATGGTPEMSSYTDDEMERLDAGFDAYRTDDPPREFSFVVHERFLPRLLEVEWNFQGNGPRYRSRPRTDGGDVHESKLLSHCEKALTHLERSTLDMIDRIYLAVCNRLEWLTHHQVGDPVSVFYRRLIAAYNSHHVAGPVRQLHVAVPRRCDLDDEDATWAS